MGTASDSLRGQWGQPLAGPGEDVKWKSVAAPHGIYRHSLPRTQSRDRQPCWHYRTAASGRDISAAELWAGPFAEIAASIEEDGFGPAKLADAIKRSVSHPTCRRTWITSESWSLHKSKGLTADLVVVCGCLQGLIPNIDTDNTPQEQQRSLEEQRRLFYVAITRTRQTLILSSMTGLPAAAAFKMPRTIRTVNGTARTIASQFIHELGPQCPAAVTGQQFLANMAVQA